MRERYAKRDRSALPCTLDKRTDLGCCRGGCAGETGAAKTEQSPSPQETLASIGKTPNELRQTMFHRVFSVAVRLCAAAAILSFAAAQVALSASPALAQNTDAKPADQNAPAAGQETAQKIDEFAEAQKALAGPAGNPECVWLGRRVVSLLWRDDLDTAFRHLDLYDRFGCPGGHIQESFRCLILHSATIDPKAPDSLNARVHACWINPALQVSQPATPAPAAAVPSPTTSR
jgi:hypothetical protein